MVSFADSGVDTELVLSIAADLASLGDIKASRVGRPVSLTLASEGLSWGDGKLTVTFSAPGSTLSADGPVRWPVRIDGRGTREFGWRLTVTDPDAVVAAAGSSPSAAVRSPSAAVRSSWAVRATADDPRLPALIGR